MQAFILRPLVWVLFNNDQQVDDAFFLHPERLLKQLSLFILVEVQSLLHLFICRDLRFVCDIFLFDLLLDLVLELLEARHARTFLRR